jgi:hypothetical protein
MSAGDLDDFWVHTVSVEMFLGAGAYGDIYAAPVNVLGFMDGSRKLVRGANGEQVVSESTFYTYPITGPLFATDSRVTQGTEVSYVIKNNTNDSGALGLPDHAAINLT